MVRSSLFVNPKFFQTQLWSMKQIIFVLKTNWGKPSQIIKKYFSKSYLKYQCKQGMSYIKMQTYYSTITKFTWTVYSDFQSISLILDLLQNIWVLDVEFNRVGNRVMPNQPIIFEYRIINLFLLLFFLYLLQIFFPTNLFHLLGWLKLM